MLGDGYHEVPANKVAFVVTSLEMLARPAPRPLPVMPESMRIRRVAAPDAEWYRDLFRRVGADWLWFARLKLSTGELEAIIHDPKVEVFAISAGDRDEGLLELDFRKPDECELSYFGLTPQLVGHGAGRHLMHRALEEAWSRPIRRFWVHTCTGDHPGAVSFYMRSGFAPFKRQIEVADDPRVASLMPVASAPHVPMLKAWPMLKA